MTTVALLSFGAVAPLFGWALGVAILVWVVGLSNSHGALSGRLLYVAACTGLIVLIFQWGLQFGQPALRLWGYG